MALGGGNGVEYSECEINTSISIMETRYMHKIELPNGTKLISFPQAGRMFYQS